MRDLTTWTALQALVGVSSESADIDFKATLDPSTKKIEFAKDVAALANVVGGHLLVGVSTEMEGTRCTGFHGIDKDLASHLTKVFEEEAKDRCRPTPIFSVRSVSVPESGKVVVVVTVSASPIAPIGVRLRQASGGHLVDEGWAFPHRVGSLTHYLQPDQFGAYDSMSARRSAALLHSIPPEQREPVFLRWVVQSFGDDDSAALVDGSPLRFVTTRARFDRVDMTGNVATFTNLDDRAQVEVPLDKIQTVWRRHCQGQPQWEVSVSGSLREGEYWPPP